MYYDSAGRYADVIRLTDKELAGGAQASASQLGWLCIAYDKVKEYTKALECADALDARLAQGDLLMKGTFVVEWNTDARPVPDMVRAEVYTDLGQYANALKAGDHAIAVATDGQGTSASAWTPERFEVTVLGTLVLAARLNGENERALHYLSTLENVSIPFMGSDLVEAYKSNSLARAYLALGKYDKALEQLGDRTMLGFSAALVNAFSPFASQGDSVISISEIPRQMMRGKALAETGKTADAKAEFDQILAHPRINDMGDLHWLALYERGRIAEKDKEGAKAVELYAKAVEVIEQQRASINTEASKIGFVGDKQAVYERLIALLVEQGHPAEAFDYVERSKSRALVDMLASKKNFATPGEDPAKVTQVLAQLDAADLASHAQAEAARNGESSGVRNLTLARQEIMTTAPELSSLVTVNSVPPNELKQLVGENEALVEYYYQGSDLYVFVLDRQRLQAIRLDGTGLAEQVQAFRKAVEDPANSAWQSASQALYQRLWQPIQGTFNASKVIVVPHGVLHYLPFEALQAPDGHLLIERYGMRMLPSASLLKFLPPALPKSDAPLLVLGNPDLGDPRLDLQFAETEAKTVAGMIHGSRLLVRKEASETNFKNAGGIFSRIHFATHGKFQADRPLDSGLYLAKDAANDGVLTVGELYSMHLDADLVTLSACETGLGKVANGDDVVGLTRGFLYAGSRSIVASLWSVDDKATSELMESFYANLASMDKEEALRQAQLKTRRSFPHPFYWAAFQLTGRGN